MSSAQPCLLSFPAMLQNSGEVNPHPCRLPQEPLATPAEAGILDIALPSPPATRSSTPRVDGQGCVLAQVPMCHADPSLSSASVPRARSRPRDNIMYIRGSACYCDHRTHLDACAVYGVGSSWLHVVAEWQVAQDDRKDAVRGHSRRSRRRAVAACLLVRLRFAICSGPPAAAS